MKRYYPHIIVLCVLAALLNGGFFSPLQDSLTDFRFQTVSRTASGQVVVVAIDSRSLQDVGVWPWPRRLHAELIQKLQDAGVTNVVFDVDLSVRSSPADDAAFAAALREAGGSVVLPVFKQATTKSGAERDLHINRALPEFRAHAWEASVNVSVAPDGRVRRYAFSDEINGELFPSAAAMLTSGAPGENSAPFYIDYGIKLSDIPIVSLADVLNGRIGAASLRDKGVIVGGTAIELGDRYLVPSAGYIAGPKLHALAAESILQGRALAATSNAVTAAGLVGLVLLMLALWQRLGLAARTILLLSLATAIEMAAVAVQASAAVIVHTAVWHSAILVYLAVGWLSEIDLRGLLAKIAKQRFQSIAMSLRDGVMCADHRGVVTFWNPAAESIFGLTVKQAVGRSFADFCKVRDATGAANPADLAALLASDWVPELVGVRKSGETFPLEVTLSHWPGHDRPLYGAVLRDISERKREDQRMRHLALHDSLTDVLNRAGLQAALSAAMERQHGATVPLTLILIDLDNFKDINDTLGHQAGDEVLRQIAGRLRAAAAPGDHVGRLGGDEFAIAVEGPDAPARAGVLAQTIADLLREPSIVVDGRAVFTGATVGLAVAEPSGQTLDELLVNADLALYRAKSVERGSCVVYSADLRQALEHRHMLEQELRQAVARGEFELYYQPQFRLRDNALVGVEALLRWRHPVRGLLAPDQFLDVLNGTDLSNEVGSWVLETACRQARRWYRMNCPLRVGANLAPSQLRSDLPALIERVLGETGLPPALLELEVTENILLDQSSGAQALLARLHSMGVIIAFDDFGTGYASLTHLRQFSLDRLKIDRSFVCDLGSNPQNAAIVAAVAGLGKRLGISVIAEGVESAQLVEQLLDAGCDEGQGYLFGRPMPADRIELMLAPAQADPDKMIATAA